MKQVLKNIIFSIVIILVFCYPQKATAQPDFPENGEVYRDDIVPRVDILINPDSLDLMYEDVESFHEFPALFIFNNGDVHDTVGNIGFRLRGNTSRYSKKKSFKVSFNTFEPGSKYRGLEKMNLNGEHNDPSVIRSKLCWDVLRKLEIPAPRSNHVEVYINDNYYGLYINVEHVDEEFVDSRFNNSNGNLYKCLWPASLQYLGSNPDNYKFEQGDRRAYDLKTNTAEDDYSDLAEFIGILQHASNDDLQCELEKVFNVNDYLKVMAFDILYSNWDGYIFNQNNFYLYHNTETGKFEWIPYDVDNTFGIDWFNIDWGTRDIYNWGPGEGRPLFDRLMSNQKYRDQYSYYVNLILTEFFAPGIYFPEIDQIRDMIYPYVIDDPYYPQDYGYTIQDFLDSYYVALGGHAKYGLKEYVQMRNTKALVQLDLNDIFPIVKYIDHNFPALNEQIVFSAYVEDDSDNVGVECKYWVNDDGPYFMEMFDDGNHNDGDAGDRIYGNAHEGYSSPGSFEFQIMASDNLSQTTLLPCESIKLHIGAYVGPPLFINEFMADNDTYIADEHGEFDDWIEVYNGANEPIWLGDKFLSDKPDSPDKWQMPDHNLAPGGFVLFWADNSPEQGSFHTNFKLNKDGEDIILSDSPENGYGTIDEISFGPQDIDISFGRIEDGHPDWQFFVNATPGYSNTAYGIGDPSGIEPLSIYPNPNSSGVLYLSKEDDIRIIDLSGRVVLDVENVTEINISHLMPSIYFVRNRDGAAAKLVVWR